MPSAPPLSVRDNADVLSTGQTARQLGCSEAWVRRLVLSGRLAAIETPLGRLIPASAVETLAQERARRRGEAPDAA